MHWLRHNHRRDPRLNAGCTFHFRALPWRLHELDALAVEDWRDNRYAHHRWIWIKEAFNAWLKKKQQYDQDPEVQENTSLRTMNVLPGINRQPT